MISEMLTTFGILLAVWFFGALLFHQLEQRLPQRNVLGHYQTGFPRRKGYVADTLWAAVNGPGLSALEKAIFTGLISLLPVAGSWAVVGGWPWWGQFALFFLANDFMRYWLHRWYHESDLLWRVHRVHHSPTEMDAMSVYRHHTLEAICKNGLIFMPFRLLGVDPGVMIAYTCLDIVKGYWHHANFRMQIGPLNYILNSPELHWWHHAIESRGQMSNYGSTLSIWDWIFGTAYWPRGRWPERIGVEGLENFPRDFVGQLTSVVHDEEAARRRYSAPERRAEAERGEVCRDGGGAAG